MGTYSKHTIKRRVICYVVSFIACMVTFVICCLFLCYVTVLNSDYITSNIEKTGYYEDLKRVVNEDLFHLGRVSGVPDSVFKDIVTTEKLKGSTNLYINTQMHVKTYERDSRSLIIDFKSSINKYYNTQKIDTTEAQYVKNVDDFVNACIDVYYKKVLLKYVHGFGLSVYKINQYIVYVFIGLIILDLMLFGLIMVINRRAKTKLRFIIVSLLGSSCMLLTVPLIIDINGTIMKINVNTEIMYNMMTDMANRIVNTFYIFGFVLLIVSFGLFLEYLRKDRLSKRENNVV